MAVCSRTGCQGCRYHRLASRTPLDEPGPSSYALPDLTTQVPGGRFNASNPKNYLDWIQYHESRKPGPADYPDRSGERVGGGRFNKSKAKTNLEWVMHYAAQRPGPTDHPGVRAALAATKPNVGVGAKFSLANTLSDVEWKIREQGKLPGPGDHGVVGVPAMGRLGRARGSSLKGTWGVADHHHDPLPPAPHIPHLRSYGLD